LTTASGQKGDTSKPYSSLKLHRFSWTGKSSFNHLWLANERTFSDRDDPSVLEPFDDKIFFVHVNLGVAETEIEDGLVSIEEGF
jgi:hypothetical protein